MRAAIFAFFMSTVCAVAGDVALVIGNETYRNGRDFRGAGNILQAVETLRRGGFDVVSGRNLSAPEQRSVLNDFAAKADGSGRIVIALAGRFAQVAGQGYLLGTNAQRVEAGSLGNFGMSLAQLQALAARAPGGAVILLAPYDFEVDKAAAAGPGVGRIEAPQGVTIIEAPLTTATRLLSRSIPERGVSVAAMLEDAPDARASGFLSDLVAFRPAQQRPALPSIDRGEQERALWRATQRIATADAYRNYLRRYPQGLFAADARAEIERIEASPEERAAQVEASLGLDRSARRQLQRNLSLLDFDTRGVDGIFGPGTRRAVRSWQDQNGEPVTGYFNRSQVTLLQRQAERRAEELEEEAERKRAELERQDRSYWRSTGRLGDEAGLRAYLERYPDGLFSDLARQRLAPFEEQRRAQAAQQDRAAWEQAEASGTVAAYREYLQQRPDGAFVAEAEARIAQIRNARSEPDNPAAARAEDQLRMNGGTRRLIESRLAKLGLDPGVVDGTFDGQTRRALRRYQEARGLPRTGYVSQSTLIRLMADAVFK